MRGWLWRFALPATCMCSGAFAVASTLANHNGLAVLFVLTGGFAGALVMKELE